MVVSAANPAPVSDAEAGRLPPRQDAPDAPPASPGERPDRPGIAQQIKSLFEDIPGLISDRVHLAALELKRARQALVEMVGLAVAVAILMATAWIALWALLVVGAVRLGLSWVAAFGIMVLINLLGSWFAIQRARALAGYLALPATVRRLGVAPSTSPPAAKVDNPPEPRPATPGVPPT